MNQPTCISIDNVAPILQELETAFFNIPFENSAFQNEAFVVAAQQTPGRAYRAVGLRMFTKIRAIKEHLIQRQRNDIDIEEKQELIAACEGAADKFKRRRLELDLLQLKQGQEWGDKLMNDALHELTTLYTLFKKLPRYTRDQFEAEELAHYTARLNRQVAARGNGAVESIANMTEDRIDLDRRIDYARQFMESGDEKFLLLAAGIDPAQQLIPNNG